jgi:hypothetical protein
MFEREFERLYQIYCDAEMSPHLARDRAADDAWAAYETYCEDKRDEMRHDRKT